MFSVIITEKGRSLSLCLPASPGLPARCSVKAPSTGRGEYHILDAQEQAFAALSVKGYGVSEVSIHGHKSLICEGQADDLEFAIKAFSGKPVGIARVEHGSEFGSQLQVKTLPGMDALLVLAVILALVIFIE